MDVAWSEEIGLPSQYGVSAFVLKAYLWPSFGGKGLTSNHNGSSKSHWNPSQPIVGCWSLIHSKKRVGHDIAIKHECCVVHRIKDSSCYALSQNVEPFHNEARNSSLNLVLRTPYKPLINIYTLFRSVSQGFDALKADLEYY